MTYLGPDTMELPEAQGADGREPFTITPGMPEPLVLRLLGKIGPGDRVGVPSMEKFGAGPMEFEITRTPDDLADPFAAGSQELNLYRRIAIRKQTVKVRPA